MCFVEYYHHNKFIYYGIPYFSLNSSTAIYSENHSSILFISRES